MNIEMQMNRNAQGRKKCTGKRNGLCIIYYFTFNAVQDKSMQQCHGKREAHET
jgi:hypothetical protein